MTDPSELGTEQPILGSPTLGERITDVFVAPTRAMHAVARQPAWWLPALISFTVVALFTLVNVQELTLAQLEAQLETASGQQAEVLASQIELFEDPPAWLRAFSALGGGVGVVFGGLIFALFCHLFIRLSEGQGRLGQTVGVVFWAGLIAYAFKTLLAWIVLVVTGSVRLSSLSAAAFIGDGNPQSLPTLLGNLLGDPFVWWMLFVVMVGMAVAHKLAFARAATVVAATYLLLAAIMTGFSLVGTLVSGA
jgi:hypothetical protein